MSRALCRAARRGGMEYRQPAELGGVFWFSTVTAFLLAFTIGANDVANNFGTSVGSGAVSMRTAIVVAGVAEVRARAACPGGPSGYALRQRLTGRPSAVGADSGSSHPGQRRERHNRQVRGGHACQQRAAW